MHFTIWKTLGQQSDFVTKLEELGLDYDVKFSVTNTHMGLPTPVVLYLGVPLTEQRACKMLKELYEEKGVNSGN